MRFKVIGAVAAIGALACGGGEDRGCVERAGVVVEDDRGAQVERRERGPLRGAVHERSDGERHTGCGYCRGPFGQCTRLSGQKLFGGHEIKLDQPVVEHQRAQKRGFGRVGLLGRCIDDLEDAFPDCLEVTGGGGGDRGWNIDLELALIKPACTPLAGPTEFAVKYVGPQPLPADEVRTPSRRKTDPAAISSHR